jgi:hypothetical protein
VLARNVDPEPATEAKLRRHRRDGVDADAMSGIVKEDVAGMLDCIAHGQAAMAAFLPAVEHRVAKQEISGQKKCVSGAIASATSPANATIGLKLEPGA